jgi:NitT/TauT family transport system substrate-binding protein
MAGRVPKFLALVFLALVAALGLIVSPVAAQTTVRVASAGIASDIGFFLALKKGYFRDEGLTVELTQMANAPQMIGPLGMGQLDVGAGTVAASLYNAVAQNITIRAVADKGSMRQGYGFSGLMVRKDLVDSGRYKTYADLKGMKLAVGTFGSANASAMNEALKKGGLKWSDAASIVALVFPQHIVAYQNKAIDASMTNEPTSTTVVQNGLAVRVAGNDEIYPSQQTAVVLYSENFARQKPQVAQKFMRAYVRAVRDYNDALKDGHIAGPNAEEVIATLVEHTFIKDAAIHRSITPAAIDPDGRMNLDGLRNDLAFFKEQKLLQDPNITVERIIDTSFVEQAVKELGPYKPRN